MKTADSGIGSRQQTADRRYRQEIQTEVVSRNMHPRIARWQHHERRRTDIPGRAKQCGHKAVTAKSAWGPDNVAVDSRTTSESHCGRHDAATSDCMNKSALRRSYDTVEGAQHCALMTAQSTYPALAPWPWDRVGSTCCDGLPRLLLRKHIGDSPPQMAPNDGTRAQPPRRGQARVAVGPCPSRLDPAGQAEAKPQLHHWPTQGCRKRR